MPEIARRRRHQSHGHGGRHGLIAVFRDDALHTPGVIQRFNGDAIQ